MLLIQQFGVASLELSNTSIMDKPAPLNITDDTSPASMTSAVSPGSSQGQGYGVECPMPPPQEIKIMLELLMVFITHSRKT
jgi:hypothetical protein